VKSISEKKTIYGPVPSWRLGRSLGIDVLPSTKTCTFDCVYCQLGKTAIKISNPEDLKIKVNAKKVIEDLRIYLKTLNLDYLDVITFSGLGEPTLNLELGQIIKQTKKLVSDVPIAVLTNASLTGRVDVRKNLAEADMIIAKLDAPSESIFKRINRPAKGLELGSVIQGLKNLKREIRSKLVIQIMFLKSRDNMKFNTKANVIKKLIYLISCISPDEVQINTPTRPPSEKNVLPLNRRQINKIKNEFKKELNIKVVARSSPYIFNELKQKYNVSSYKVLELLKRRPCSLQDLINGLNASENNIKSRINQLIIARKVKSRNFLGEIYYKPT
jgi:wyosine [tRNA(Phe)-imidazoG37] synthetase (radical SAM superfamily)